MCPRVISLSLILLFAGAVVSYKKVSGVVGWPVTLPCSYSVANGVTSMCWGKGVCPASQCSEQIIWTDGNRITFQKHTRYDLKGNILQGDVSLTIEDAVETDSGLYCCRVEHRGWFNDQKITLSLEIKPARNASIPTSPSFSTSAPPTPTPTQNHKPVATSSSPTQPTETQHTTLQKTRTQPTSSPSLYSCPTDGNGTMTQTSDGLWHNNETQVFPAQRPWSTARELSIGICVSVLVLVIVFVIVIIKKYFYIKEKMQTVSMVSLNGSQTGTLQTVLETQVRAEDNIYIIEDDLYVME
ncbi:hepatitis A virus cellular receptor 1 [Ochotona princeps]|uniref:hepatitis A virus cellular receptor 1 n=1 Tax=Ochotona princeps TaxID=9978 RepID=UPI002714D7A5|nr:hepatitis A virus cellular receptor 1 [Ochotona princeps]